jgi:hypothetical protein
MLAFRLMAAGHTVHAAEDWCRAFPAWQEGTALDAFVEANARSWHRAADKDPQEWKLRAARLAARWDEERRAGNISGC